MNTKDEKEPFVDDLKEKYLKNLSGKEKVGIEIARKQLGSSFCLERSLGYLQFLKKETDKQ